MEKLDIKLKISKITEIINYIEGKNDSLEDIEMYLLDNDNYKLSFSMTPQDKSVVFHYSLTNKKTGSVGSTLKYIKTEEDLFRIYKLNLLNKDISIKLDMLDRDKKHSYSLFKIYRDLIDEDFSVFYDLFEHNQFNEDIYLAEILALIIPSKEEYELILDKDEKKFIREKLNYFGFNFETLNQIEMKSEKTVLDRLIYAGLFELFIGSRKKRNELIWEVEDSYIEFLKAHYSTSSHMKTGGLGLFITEGDSSMASVMGCRTTSYY